jgi:carbon-monoxide dehydrogenase large subunit
MDHPMDISPADGWFGARFNRKEDLRLTTGRGRYIADIVVPGMLHLVFVRSQVAHARIKRIDTSAAKAMPGVVAVVTGEDIKDRIAPLPQPVVVPNMPAKYPTHWPLAVGKVRFHGDALAAVVARDKYVAEDAAEAIEVDYEELPYVGDPEAALQADAPIVHEGWDNNLIFEMTLTGGATPEEQAKNDAKVQEAFDSAEIVVSERFRCHRCGVTPMETRGALCLWDDSDGLTAYVTTQRPHIDRLALSDILNIPAEKVRVIAPRDQGGGFGVKAPFYREPIIVAYMAQKLGRPMRWIESRQEHLMVVSQERDQIHDLEVAATKDGRLLALRDRGIGDCGDGCEGVYWGFLMPFLGAVELPNGYAWPIGDVKIKGSRPWPRWAEAGRPRKRLDPLLVRLQQLAVEIVGQDFRMVRQRDDRRIAHIDRACIGDRLLKPLAQLLLRRRARPRSSSTTAIRTPRCSASAGSMARSLRPSCWARFRGS